MPARNDRDYEEAIALWRSLTDAPPPVGDASTVLEAAIALTPAEGYRRFHLPELNDPTLTWAVYRDAPPDQA